MAALWQSLGRRCHDRLIYPSAVRIRRALVLLVLVACAALSACGGGDDDKSDDATPGPSASSDPTEATSGYVGDISLFTQWYSFDGTDQENLPKSKALAEAVVDELT